MMLFFLLLFCIKIFASTDSCVDGKENGSTFINIILTPINFRIFRSFLDCFCWKQFFFSISRLNLLNLAELKIGWPYEM